MGRLSSVYPEGTFLDFSRRNVMGYTISGNMTHLMMICQHIKLASDWAVVGRMSYVAWLVVRAGWCMMWFDITALGQSRTAEKRKKKWTDMGSYYCMNSFTLAHSLYAPEKHSPSDVCSVGYWLVHCFCLFQWTQASEENARRALHDVSRCKTIQSVPFRPLGKRRVRRWMKPSLDNLLAQILILILILNHHWLADQMPKPPTYLLRLWQTNQ